MRELLPDLELTVAAHATDAVPQGAGNGASASGKHDLTSVTIPASGDAEVLSVGDRTYVIWRTSIQLSRPRARLQRPAIYFTANLTISSKALATSRKPAGDYLQAFQTLPENILDPLNFSPSYGQEKTIYLSADRFTKVTPSAPRLEDAVKPIRGASKRAFPAVPAMFTKVRISHLPDSVIASLHIETSNVIAGSVSIEDVRLEVLEEKKVKLPTSPNEPSARPSVHDMNATSWPRDSRAGDEVVCLYKLTPNKNASTVGSCTLDLSIKAVASLDQGSSIPISISWQTQVDLSQTLSKPNYRWSPARPVSTPSSQLARPSSSGIPKPKSVEEPRLSSGGSVEAGITFVFTGPETVHQHEAFDLYIHCKNNSERLRRFAFTSVQPQSATTTTVSQPKPSSDRNADIVAGIFNFPPLQRQKPADVHLLTPDVRIGPLASGAVHETSMTFRAAATGVLDLGVVRIADVDTTQTVDVKELPDVFALEPLEEHTEDELMETSESPPEYNGPIQRSLESRHRAAMARS